MKTLAYVCWITLNPELNHQVAQWQITSHSAPISLSVSLQTAKAPKAGVQDSNIPIISKTQVCISAAFLF